MHLCTCEIAVGGDIRNTVIRSEFEPVSYPEIEILKFIHGAGAVTDVAVCGEIDRDPGEEKAMLLQKYPAKAVETLYPGTRPPMEMELRGVKIEPKKKAPRKRAHKVDGSFMADNPETPNINEAFEVDGPFTE